MVESDKEKRIRFPSGTQAIFIDKCLEVLNITTARFAEMTGVNPRTAADWRRGKFLMSAYAAKLISLKSAISIPPGAKSELRYWYVNKGAKMGGKATYKKYSQVGGSAENRKKLWREWWEKEGRLKSNPLFAPKPIYEPKASSTLAEFVGIMMGDGSITKSQITITLHHTDDLAYSKFVTKLIQRLFHVQPSVYHSEKSSVNDIVVSRVVLVKYLNSLGLPIGNKVKQRFDIPNWIKTNKKFSVACVRGLIDTDGSVFNHRYWVRGKRYSYKKLDFASASHPLLHSVFLIMRDNGLNPRITKDGRKIRLERVEDVEKYFKTFKPSNEKHLKRYQN
ncbi:MAG: Uncharacterized protein LiPW15_705 [Parcubacteria group bacterium LiPW_15]|nr:MAG: Uncharacterized protein LiPW15_705 [Parcubacteria group bacterium LiPW_15]